MRKMKKAAKESLANAAAMNVTKNKIKFLYETKQN